MFGVKSLSDLSCTTRTCFISAEKGHMLISLSLLQEYYIRHLDDNAATSVDDRDRLCRALEAAIQRRYTDVIIYLFRSFSNRILH